MSDTKSLLANLAPEGAEPERTVRGTVTDGITAWANSQYLYAAHASLTTAADRLEQQIPNDPRI